MSFLEILAECSITLTGFGAVFSVLRGADTPRGVFRAWTVVSQSGIAFLLSLVPLALALSSITTATLWFTASAIGLAATSYATFNAITLDRRFSAKGFPPQATIMIRSSQVCCVLSVLGMLLNTLGWPFSAGPGLYAGAVVLLLVASLMALLHSFFVPLQLTLTETESAPVIEDQAQ